MVVPNAAEQLYIQDGESAKQKLSLIVLDWDQRSFF